MEEHFDDGDSDDEKGIGGMGYGDPYSTSAAVGSSSSMVQSSYVSSFGKGMGSGSGSGGIGVVSPRAPSGAIAVSRSSSIIIPSSSSPVSMSRSRSMSRGMRESNNTPQRVEREDAGKGWVGHF